MNYQTGYTIRPASANDAASVSKLLASAYPVLLKYDYAPSILDKALPSMVEAQPALLTSGTYFLVEIRGRIVAAGGWSWSAPTGSSTLGSRTTGHTRHVVTDHRFTRMGAGRALMEHVLRSARQEGADKLNCFSTLTAVPFYEAVGFDQICPIDLKVSPGVYFPAVQMCCCL